MKQEYINDKGIALPIVIIVMAVLMVFGAVFTNITLAENRFAVHEERLIQANYLARAGVDDIAAEIIEAEAAPSGIDAGDVQDLGDGKSYIVNEISEITDSGYVGYFVSVTGRNHGVNSTLGLTITRDKPSDLLDSAIYSVENLDITLMQVEGDIASGGDITYSTNGSNIYDTGSYTATEDKDLEFSYQQLPIDDPRSGLSYEPSNPSRNINSDFTISESRKYDTINLNSGTLTFDTGASSDGILEIAIDSLTLNPGTVIKVDGDGLLKLYIMDDMLCKGAFDIEDTSANKADLELLVYRNATADFQTPIQLNPSADPNRARIYLDQDSTLILQANGNFNAYIIGPEASILMQSGNTTVNGSIIGNVVNGTGNKPMGAVHYQKPDDSWELTDPAFNKRFYE